ncbi:hypothetical protein AV654_19505 [Paenibacillus elgii]|uniref:Uncharacterized protein n=1 Tax=Paenibacillus elgii TaxID=189691 RepID=A0A161S1Q1_9BACL|nr:hypothetical protein AV654_19505 [Paenibacillus elgii]
MSGRERRERSGASGSDRPSENGAAARNYPEGNVANAPERPAAVGQLRAERQYGIVWVGTSRALRSVRPRSANSEPNSSAELSVQERRERPGTSGRGQPAARRCSGGQVECP